MLLQCYCFEILSRKTYVGRRQDIFCPFPEASRKKDSSSSTPCWPLTFATLYASLCAQSQGRSVDLGLFSPTPGHLVSSNTLLTRLSTPQGGVKIIDTLSLPSCCVCKYQRNHFLQFQFCIILTYCTAQFSQIYFDNDPQILCLSLSYIATLYQP